MMRVHEFYRGLRAEKLYGHARRLALTSRGRGGEARVAVISPHDESAGMAGASIVMGLGKFRSSK